MSGKKVTASPNNIPTSSPSNSSPSKKKSDLRVPGNGFGRKISGQKTTAPPNSITTSSSPSSPVSMESDSPKKRPLSKNKSDSQPPGDGFGPKVVLLEQGIIGYVHNLSHPRRNRGNTLDYCTFLLQTATENIEALLYSTHKRPLLLESQDRHTPVKLTYFTYTPDNGKLIVNDMTTITMAQQHEYSFQFNKPTERQSDHASVLDVLNTHKEWEVVTVQGKIFGVKDQRTVGSPRKRLRLMEAFLDDGSGRIPIDIWESHIETIKPEQVYTLTNVQVRVWSGRKKLSTTISTVVQPFDDPMLRELPTENAEAEQEQTMTISTVDSIQRVIKYFACKHCQRKIIQGTCADVITCEHCGHMMKTEACQTKVSAKIVILVDNQECVFKLDHELLQKMYPDVISMDTNTLGRQLLYGLDNRSIRYNTESLNIMDIDV